MNDEVHAARFVLKSHTSSLAAFASPNAGPLGWIVEGRVRIVTRVARVSTFAEANGSSAAACEGRVVLLTAGVSDEGLAVDLLRDSFEGMVIEATGGGHVSPGMAEALERAARRIPVILASRAPAGESLSATYGFVGGEIDLQRRGLIRAGWLDGVKARVLLSLLLRCGYSDPSRIRKEFEAWGGG
jgi:L-asparaginase